MHWFWRAAIAVFGGAVFSTFYFVLLFSYMSPFMAAAAFICRTLGSNSIEQGWQGAVAYTVVISLPIFLFPLAVFGIVTSRFGPQARLDGETRCRKCGYILLCRRKSSALPAE